MTSTDKNSFGRLQIFFELPVLAELKYLALPELILTLWNTVNLLP